MLSLTTPQLRQIQQIKKHNSILFADLQTKLAKLPVSYSPKATGKIIGSAMAELAASLAQAQAMPPKIEPFTAPGPVLFDLLISSKRDGYGFTDTALAPILWWKMAGHQKQEPGRKMSLVDPALMERLLDYELVATEVQTNQIIRKYRRLK